MKNVKRLYAVELDVSLEACIPDYWVIHDESEDAAPGLCVYETEEEALEAAKGRDHQSRVVTFVRISKKAKEVRE